MYSVLKGQHVGEDTRVIDSNELLEQRIRAFNEQLEREKEEHREQLLMDFLDTLEPDEEGNYFLNRDEEGEFIVPRDDDGNPLVDYDENGMLIPASDEEPMESEEEGEGPELDENGEPIPEVDPHEQAEAIIGSARFEAESILQEAQEQAEAFRSNARAEGHDEGFLQGQAQAMAEVNDIKAQCEAEAAQLREEYAVMRESMERELVDVIAEVMGKAFVAKFCDDEEVIFHLVDQALSHIENSKELLIRVNEEGYAFLSERRDVLQEKVGTGVQLDIVRDPLMADGACLIETDGGVFDVGLDTQMKNLVSKIRMLSI